MTALRHCWHQAMAQEQAQAQADVANGHPPRFAVALAAVYVDLRGLPLEVVGIAEPDTALGHFAACLA